jgi:hypothetical protein
MSIRYPSEAYCVNVIVLCMGPYSCACCRLANTGCGLLWANTLYVFRITLFQASAHVIYVARGASKVIYPTIVMLIIIFWYPCFKEVRCCVCRSECDSQVSTFTQGGNSSSLWTKIYLSIFYENRYFN